MNPIPTHNRPSILALIFDPVLSEDFVGEGSVVLLGLGVTVAEAVAVAIALAEDDCVAKDIG